jgi:hypothetical protein
VTRQDDAKLTEIYGSIFQTLCYHIAKIGAESRLKRIIAITGSGIADEATEKEAEEIGRLIAWKGCDPDLRRPWRCHGGRSKRRTFGRGLLYL